MNFMDSRRGFYEGGSKCTIHDSQSSSSSSSKQKSPLIPFSYNRHHHQQQRPSCVEINYESNNQESRLRQQTELTMESLRASVGDSDANDSQEPHQFVVRGGWGGTGGGGGGESSGGMEVIEREHMFDKVVTPSDVGKLNRLVIPKQQAEKYFPLDSTTNEKGLLLNFEDRNGKPWRFRYSYWKSSQSYVMTKGWSRFVKDKKLDAGDVVSFQRGVGDLAKDRLFIDWRRRRPEPPHHYHPHHLPHPIPSFSLSTHFSWNNHHHQHQNHPHMMQANYLGISPHQSHHYGSYSPYNNGYGNANQAGMYLKSGSAIGGGGWVGAPQDEAGAGGGIRMQFQRGGVEGMGIPMTMPIPPSMVYESVPVVHGKVAAKKMRLFGVNMECPITENTQHEILSSTTLTHFSSITPSHHNHHHRPNNSSTPSLSLRPYFLHPQQNVNDDDKGKSSMSLDLDLDI